ncbi:hypothetical protein ZIOFF_034451 [Zingiber officinale]|uniref:Neprosin PEP catalytic domain-containing protein n=1 Tax=Zingiber officinale TaxID=94328 RepID=A0A8J5L8F1_ZINOF|nr:hypothetical protein ZIOFF_034451 [Zingiber officinale]
MSSRGELLAVGERDLEHRSSTRLASHEGLAMGDWWHDEAVTLGKKANHSCECRELATTGPGGNLKPSSLPKEMKLAKFKPASFNGFNDTCPSGTVLIHRAGKQDLIESQPLRNKFRAQAVVNNLTTEGSHDSNTGNWWITYNDQLPLGYFPKELLPKMDDYANVVQMGGFVDSPLNVPSPPMGSGHPCNEGRNKAAYFIQVQFMDSSNNLYNLNPLFIVPYTDNDDYYSVADDHYEDDKDKYVFAYGGVGGF